MRMRFRQGPCSFVMALALGLVTGPAGEARAQAGAATALAATGANIVRFDPALSSAAILARPDTDMVELPNGRRIRVADIRRLSGHAQRMQAPAGSRSPAALRALPAASGTRVGDAAELAAALKRGDSETVTLPSGRRATVAQIRFVQAHVEKKIGRSLAVVEASRPSLSGAAIKVTAQSDFKDILQKPAATVLEAPDGTRITVGELRQALAQDGAVPGRR